MIPDTKEQVLVSVQCLVYNHAPYLRQCLDGFVMQRTTFSYEVIVHDDASTDGSSDIIREYAQMYPHLFKVIIQPENIYSKGISPTRMYVTPLCAGKYIACCEGDDYWTDSDKLQKQVDFLENHPEYNICFHDVQVLDAATGQIGEDTITRDVPGTSGIGDLVKGNYIHTPSILFRYEKDIQARLVSLGPCIPSDYAMWMLLAEHGKIYKMPDVMAVYRKGSGIWSTAKSIKNDLLYLSTLNKLYVAIDNAEVRANLQKQINGIIEAMTHMEKDLHRVQQSKAYRLGKALLKPFGWLRRVM